MGERRKRVLVIAEAANPEWVSVPLVGWSLASALRDVADVHVVTQVRNREAILRAGLEEGRDFTAIDSEAVARPLWRVADLLRMGKGKGWTTTTAIAALSYPYFERLTWQRFGAEIAAGAFDVVHRITPLTPTTVSPIAARCARHGVPFILGPLNGGVPWPPGFDAERRREREWLSYVRGAYRMLPGRRRMLGACAAILVGSRHTESEIPEQHRGRTIYLPENAVDPTKFGAVAAQEGAGPLRGCFVGRLVPYKGPDMAIRGAAPLMRQGRMTLDILGDGPMRAELEGLAAAEGVAASVTFHGNLPHAAVQDVLSRSNVLVFPSIREFGGGVVLEAMALGVVPIVADYAGPGELVDDATGFKIQVGPKDRIVADLGALLQAIADDPSPLRDMGARARNRVLSDFTWSAKARQVLRVYDWAVAKDGPAPVLL